MTRFSGQNHFSWASLILSLCIVVNVDYNGCFTTAFLLVPSTRRVPTFQPDYTILWTSAPSSSSSSGISSNGSDDEILWDNSNGNGTTSNDKECVTNNITAMSTENKVSNATKSSNSSLLFAEDRPIMVTGDQVGIGGRDGVRPDVNKLKRNLVQESVQKYKNELLTLLGTPPLLIKRQKNSPKSREKVMEEKIASLLEVNPVTTTTDSNILDGIWEFTLVVETTPAILNSLRYVWKGKTSNLPSGHKNLGSPFRLKNQKMENPFRESKREINLENLSDDEDPYVLDSTSYFNGLFRVETLYRVVGLTRTSLDMAVESMTTFIMDKEIRRKDSEKFVGITIPMKIVYLDTDLYIAATSNCNIESPTSGSSNNNKDGIAPLHVYTKSDVWRSSRKVRHFIAILAWTTSLQSPLHLRERIRKRLRKDDDDSTRGGNDDERTILSDKDKAALLKKIYNKNESLTIFRLGDLTDNVQDDNLAWNGDEDPFVHLSATERQNLLRSMSIQEIEEAWKEQQKISKKKRNNNKSVSKKFQKPNK